MRCIAKAGGYRFRPFDVIVYIDASGPNEFVEINTPNQLH